MFFIAYSLARPAEGLDSKGAGRAGEEGQRKKGDEHTQSSEGRFGRSYTISSSSHTHVARAAATAAGSRSIFFHGNCVDITREEKEAEAVTGRTDGRKRERQQVATRSAAANGADGRWERSLFTYNTSLYVVHVVLVEYYWDRALSLTGTEGPTRSGPNTAPIELIERRSE